MDTLLSLLSAEADVLSAAGDALVVIMDPMRLGIIAIAVVLGVIVGILPGIGGIAGMTILLPFTFKMDPYTGLAFLLGLASVTATGDPIPAILFGVPGGAGSAATVLDGLPLAKKGEAGRALSAAYFSSLLGGLFGALLLGLTIPILRPALLHVGSPELLALSIFGLTMVASLSGNTPLRGIVAACIGLTIAMVGSDPIAGTHRWTFDSFYLWDGIPLLPVVLGVFAIPEMCDLVITRQAIAGSVRDFNVYKGQWQGVKDCFSNWWLIVRASWIGALVGAMPGLGGAVADWLAYGHALRTEKGAAQTFGKGDIRGVIASESSNNAKEGGALVPTIAFGVPGSAGMAILLGAFTIHGLSPGPEMLTKHLDITFSMVWTVAIANILGAGLCFAFSPQFARLALLRYTLICPAVLGVIYIGAFEASRNWGDLYALFLAGLLGWTMKQLKWPRAPLILGLVLGDIVERYMFISVNIYGFEWFSRPVVIVLLLMSAAGLLRPIIQDLRAQGGTAALRGYFQPARFSPTQVFPALLIALFAYLLSESLEWKFESKVVPTVIGLTALLALTLSLVNQVFHGDNAADEAGMAIQAQKEVQRKIHMDIDSGTSHLATSEIIGRAGVFFGYLLGFMAVMALIGLIPTVFVFVIFFMRYEGRERWSLTLSYAVCMVLFVYFIFDQLLHLPWPSTYFGAWFPDLKFIPSL